MISKICGPLVIGVCMVLQATDGFAQTEWRVVQSIERGGNTNCRQGAMGRIVVVDNVMSFYIDGYNPVYWSIKLANDGSASATVPTAPSPARGSQVKVAAGNGPREIREVTISNACQYLITPKAN